MKSVYFCVYLSKKSYPVVVAATGFSLVRPTGFEPVDTFYYSKKVIR